MHFKNSALLFVLVVGVSVLNSGCLAQDDALTTEGSCTASDPSTCTNEPIDADADADADYVEDSVKDSNCQDEHTKCFDWSRIGECDENPGYMLHSCRRSCMKCPDQAEELAKIIEEKKKKIRVWTNEELEVAADMGEEQAIEDNVFGVSVEDAAARIIAAREHLHDAGLNDGLLEICKNQHKSCTAW